MDKEGIQTNGQKKSYHTIIHKLITTLILKIRKRLVYANSKELLNLVSFQTTIQTKTRLFSVYLIISGKYL